MFTDTDCTVCATVWQGLRMKTSTHCFWLLHPSPAFGRGVQWPRRQLLIFNHQHWLDIMTEAYHFLKLSWFLSVLNTVYRFTNFHICVARVRMMHGPYGGTPYGMRTVVPICNMHITAPFDPKSLKLSWITGTSFGLTPFWSDSIDYVACAIPVRDVTNINIVNPHWDNTTWVYRHQGISNQEVSSLCLITYNDSLPIHITKCKVIILSHQMQGDYSEVYF